MENKNNQQQEEQDFTGKGRISNDAQGGQSQDESADISNVDQQEGELNNGTVSKDDHLFSGEKKPGASS